MSMKSLVLLGIVLLLAARGASPGADAVAANAKAPAGAPGYSKLTTWQETMLAVRALVSADRASAAQHNDARSHKADPREFAAWRALSRDFPVDCDWFLQDVVACGLPLSSDANDARAYPARWFGADADSDLEQRLIAKAAEELGPAGEPIRTELNALIQARTTAHTKPWLDLYARACQLRRNVRLQTMAQLCPSLVFTRHANLGGSHYAYTEAQSDAQAERHFDPGSALCLLEMQQGEPHVRMLLEDGQGMIRDPDVSADGLRVLFAWKKSDRLDDFHLYEMELASGRIRQLTFGLGVADYEGAYLPDGRIVFSSTRCVQTVDCWVTEVSNLYAIDANGGHLHRLGFDQVHTNFPTVAEDGRVLYTRWEYNDRGQIFHQSLFQMHPDGTAQREVYGNNSWFPTTILHARNIFGTQKVLAIATGHHTRQVGKLIVLDPARGSQENAGAQLVAPVRATPAVHVDAYGQEGDLFQYPYPLSETQYLVSYAPLGWEAEHRPSDTGVKGRTPLFGVYFMTIDGQRELLASDCELSCNQPIPLHHPATRSIPRRVDYSKTAGVYYLQDIYAGPGLAGVPRGTVKRLRVIALDFRAAEIGSNGNGGVAGGAMVSTPVSVGNGCWDPKIVLGETPVHDDGSAQFTVPAQTPLYFQAIDRNGYVVQTMRSWSTLQPGEYLACIGCHEPQNSVSTSYISASLGHASAEALHPFYGPARGFSFAREIQPILDQHCIRCHNDRTKLSWIDAKEKTTAATSSTKPGEPDVERAFSLLGEENLDVRAKRRWSDAYLSLTAAKLEPRGAFRGNSTPLVNWVSPQSAPPMLAPYSAGAATSGLMQLLVNGHKNVKLNQEDLDKIACWIDLAVPYCGDYREASAWTENESKAYDGFLAKRHQLQNALADDEPQPQSANASPAGAAAATVHSAPETGVDVVIDVQAADGSVIAHQAGKALPTRALALDLPRAFAVGDMIHITGAKHLAVQFDSRLGETLIYAPSGELTFSPPIVRPGAKPGSFPFPPDAWRTSCPRITVRPAAVRELDVYRNLACNPYDVRGDSPVYPHACSNSECRNEAVFAARNAIDGFKENRRHGGWPYQSWGPDKRKDVWWQVDFGREVEIDKLVILIRADFPHDKHWKRATLVFSDGSKRSFDLEKTSEPQTITFPAKKTTSVRLTDLTQDEPLGWCALTEVQAWGRDPIAIAADLDAAAVGE